MPARMNSRTSQIFKIDMAAVKKKTVNFFPHVHRTGCPLPSVLEQSVKFGHLGVFVTRRADKYEGIRHHYCRQLRSPVAVSYRRSLPLSTL